MQPIQGLHHITAVAKDPQANIDFFHHVLGQRLIKTTVNFDDPTTYHFYYGDRTGSPGTILTFFPWKHVKQGQTGNGEAATVAYAIRPDSLGFWEAHLAQQDVVTKRANSRFGAEVVQFQAPAGTPIELITTNQPAPIQPWLAGPIPSPHILLGFHSTTLWLDEIEATGRLLTDQLGYTFVGQENNRHRYKAASDNIGVYIDLLHRPGRAQSQFGAGSIHHIAFRTTNDSEQAHYLTQLRHAGYNVSPVRDRQYFHSIYFPSPGRVLFEIATDAPGFLYDEPETQLGTTLKLPDWFEPHRPRIEQALPSIHLKRSA